LEILQILKANGIPLSGMLDVRSDPALRQQLQAVVRRAAASQPASHLRISSLGRRLTLPGRLHKPGGSAARQAREDV
jgi:hypothetical protein